jgi:hypothetical protein
MNRYNTVVIDIDTLTRAALESFRRIPFKAGKEIKIRFYVLLPCLKVYIF